MIIEFFINSCVLITAISILCIFFKDKILIKESQITIQQKFFIGIAGGLLEILLILFPVDNVIHGLSVNFHALPIMLSLFYGGSLSAIITAVIINVFGYLVFRALIVSIVYGITDFILVTGIILILNIKTIRKNKWIYCVLYSLVVNSISYIFLIEDSRLIVQFLIIYNLNNLLLTYFLYQFTEYLRKTVEVYEKFKAETTIDFLTGLNNVRQFNRNLNRIRIATQIKTEGEHIS